MGGFIHNYFLIIHVNRGDANSPGYQHIGLPRRIADFINALTGGKAFYFDLVGQHRHFFVVQQRK